MIKTIFSELPQLQKQLNNCQQDLKQAKNWHADLPVPLLDRCWLKLEVLKVAELLCRLPVDASAHAPELVRFQELRNQGHNPDLAKRICWDEFTAEACHLALRRYWEAQETPKYLWNLDSYLNLLRRYRSNVEQGQSEHAPTDPAEGIRSPTLAMPLALKTTGGRR